MRSAVEELCVVELSDTEAAVSVLRSEFSEAGECECREVYIEEGLT